MQTSADSVAFSTPSLWARVIARLIDGLVILVVVYSLKLLPAKSGSVPRYVLNPWIWGTLYHAVFIAWRGATLGKTLMTLEVVRESAPYAKPSFLRVLLRELSFSLLSFPMGAAAAGVAYLNPQRRHIGDLVAGTRVVERDGRGLTQEVWKLGFWLSVVSTILLYIAMAAPIVWLYRSLTSNGAAAKALYGLADNLVSMNPNIDEYNQFTQKQKERLGHFDVLKAPLSSPIHEAPLLLSSGDLVVGGIAVHYFDPDGKLKLRVQAQKVSTEGRTPVVLSDGSLAAQYEPDLIRLLDSQGAIRKTFAIQGMLAGPWTRLRDGSAVAAGTGRLLFVSPDEAKMIPVPNSTRFGMHATFLELDDGGLLTQSDSAIEVFGRDGKLRSTWPLGAWSHSNPLRLRDGTLFTAFSDGSTRFLSQDGKEKKLLQLGSPATSTATELANGNIVLGTADHKLRIIHPDGAELASFQATADFVAPAAQLKDGTLAAGTQAGELVFLTPDGILKDSVTLSGEVSTRPLETPSGTLVVGTRAEGRRGASLYFLKRVK
jgi:uncharacterized RDD family membrane protein YckC